MADIKDVKAKNTRSWTVFLDGWYVVASLILQQIDSEFVAVETRHDLRLRLLVKALFLFTKLQPSTGSL